MQTIVGTFYNEGMGSECEHKMRFNYVYEKDVCRKCGWVDFTSSYKNNMAIKDHDHEIEKQAHPENFEPEYDPTDNYDLEDMPEEDPEEEEIL